MQFKYLDYIFLAIGRLSSKYFPLYNDPRDLAPISRWSIASSTGHPKVVQRKFSDHYPVSFLSSLCKDYTSILSGDSKRLYDEQILV
jgi:hypothetical protein